MRDLTRTAAPRLAGLDRDERSGGATEQRKPITCGENVVVLTTLVPGRIQTFDRPAAPYPPVPHAEGAGPKTGPFCHWI